jgi:hypothetical protein
MSRQWTLLVWLSIALFVEQGIETVTVLGRSGFPAPGGAMNLDLGGLIGTTWPSERWFGAIETGSRKSHQLRGHRPPDAIHPGSLDASPTESPQRVAARASRPANEALRWTCPR